MDVANNPQSHSSGDAVLKEHNAKVAEHLAWCVELLFIMQVELASSLTHTHTHKKVKEKVGRGSISLIAEKQKQPLCWKVGGNMMVP